MPTAAPKQKKPYVLRKTSKAKYAVGDYVIARKVAGKSEVVGAPNTIIELHSAALDAPTLQQLMQEFQTVVETQHAAKKPSTHFIEVTVTNPQQTAPAPFDPAEAGRAAVKRMMLAEGGAFSGLELLQDFGLSPANLHRRRKEHRLIFWRNAKHEFQYPKWQFTPSGALLPGLEKILQAFRSTDEWRIMRYFLSPRDQLDGKTPLELLRAGETEKVMAHAQAHAEEGTW